MARKTAPASSIESAVSWAALLGLLTAASACSSLGTSAGECNTDELPASDPCHGKSCCEEVSVGPDGGLIEDPGPDAGPGVTTRICGACNG